MNYRELALDFLGDFVPRHLPLENISSLSKGEIGVLMTLKFHKDNIVAGDVSKNLNLTSGRTATILKSLEKKGLITKSKSQEDARQTIVCLTDSGKNFAKEHSEKILGHFTRLLEYLGEEDAKEFIRINKRLVIFHKGELE